MLPGVSHERHMDSAPRPIDDGCVDATYPGGDDVDPLAVPGRYRAVEHESRIPGFTLEVDGERFILRPDGQGGTHYTWSSGKNNDYGFSVGPTPNLSLDAHRENIRSFLAQIDPSTGYIEDD